ncbi:hypothetical protein BaRGS_00016864 [Batillaria attramentaria]|uniref:Uncharacterized protein n=1 Tax=Batillaria attramentaria TaxID=370345 RepID=A0ABD0KYE0_9CAEN
MTDGNSAPARLLLDVSNFVLGMKEGVGGGRILGTVPLGLCCGSAWLLQESGSQLNDVFAIAAVTVASSKERRLR